MRTITARDLSHLNITPNEIRFAPSDPDGEHEVIYLSADSRDIIDAPHTVFAAIRTSVNDGHRYIPGLFERGVRVFIVETLDNTLRELDATFIVVDSVEEALRRLAYARIRGFENGIIITGSYGKSKTKELIYRSFIGRCKVVRSPRSWNSAIGVRSEERRVGKECRL